MLKPLFILVKLGSLSTLCGILTPQGFNLSVNIGNNVGHFVSNVDLGVASEFFFSAVSSENITRLSNFRNCGFNDLVIFIKCKL